MGVLLSVLFLIVCTTVFKNDILWY